MIIHQYEKPYVPPYANYDYLPVYRADKFVGWIRMYHEFQPNKRIKNESRWQQSMEVGLEE